MIGLWCLLLAAAAPAPDAATVVERTVEGRVEVAASFPGWLVSHAIRTDELGRPEIWAVTLPAVGPPAAAESKGPSPPKCPGDGSAPPEATLFVAAPTASHGYEVHRRPVAGGILRLEVVDLDRDGVRDVAAIRAGGVVRLDGRDPAADRTVVADATISDSTRTLDGPGGPRVVSTERGALVVASPAGSSTPGRSVRAGLPVEVGRSGGAWSLSTPRPEPVGRGPEGEWILATRPRGYGSTRLRTSIIRVPADGADPVVDDCWSRLPSEEDVVESHFLLFEGRPALLVLTKEAGKLALFSEKRLRLFFLEADRTRLGRPAVLAVSTGANLWQQTFVVAGDFDGDGRADLGLAYWKGLTDDQVSVELYTRTEDGAFRRSKRSTSLDVRQGDREQVVLSDLTGDGTPELAVRSGTAIWVFHGLRDGKSAFSGRPEVIEPGWDGAPREDSTTTVVVSTGGMAVNSQGPPTTLRSEPVADGVEALVAVETSTPARIIVVRRSSSGSSAR